MKDLEEKYLFLANYLTERRKSLFEEISQNRTRYITAVVEDIHKERNASAIVRTSECLGIQDVHIIENNNKYKLSKGIAKGSDKWVDAHIYDEADKNNTEQCFEVIKKKGYKVLACTPHKEDLLVQDLPLNIPLALVFGGEKDGLSDHAFENADGFLKIPNYGFTESYNLSVSAGIILSNIIFRLRKSNIDWRLKEEDQLRLKLKWAMKTVPNAVSIMSRFNKLDE